MTCTASKSNSWVRAGAHLKVPRGPVGCKRRVSLITDSSTGSLLKSAVSLLTGPGAGAAGQWAPALLHPTPAAHVPAHHTDESNLYAHGILSTTMTSGGLIVSNEEEPGVHGQAIMVSRLAIFVVNQPPQAGPQRDSFKAASTSRKGWWVKRGLPSDPVSTFSAWYSCSNPKTPITSATASAAP
ncbi:MAG: hypothetical protein FRX49_02028 [Trebouxia sp. A1-2]|nr:MAG: hypothetical protein FRX49_02028 [Trebouxia sp. A1-2]